MRNDKSRLPGPDWVANSTPMRIEPNAADGAAGGDDYASPPEAGAELGDSEIEQEIARAQKAEQ